MKQRIANISLLVKDYDEAIRFYTNKLDFQLVEDTSLGKDKRWVRLSPPGASETCLLLAKAEGESQNSHIGNQSGGRVFLFLFTDDFQRDFEKMLSRGVEFVRPPQKEAYGTVAVFKDLYGNLWDLIEPV
jgi:catechol 2,3-dioxygenase-like lactoylglutathione lyase family enzyme